MIPIIGTQEHEPGSTQQKSVIRMRHGKPTTGDTESAGLSPSRLRVGAVMIISWLLPFWALAPFIAHSLNGLSNPPSVAAVTTTIVVVQTIIGLLGFWVAGTEVKSLIKGSSLKHALGAVWSVIVHGDVRGQGDVTTDPDEGRPPREDV